MQFTEDENSRSYLDFDSINDALDGKYFWGFREPFPFSEGLLKSAKLSRTHTIACIGMCQIYEQKLKIMNADAPQITYDLADLITYLDSLKDLCCLTYNDIQKVYIPHGRDWIKSKIYMSLKKQAK